MTKNLHIVAFDVPYPPNYGGIIDVFYKLKSLHELGIQISFHCYYYGGHNPPTQVLEKFCHKIYYYKRKKHIGKIVMNKLPFIVASRNSKNLLKNLQSDNHPILFDGLQTCFFVNHPELTNRKKFVRAHNVEHDYYIGLAKWETNTLKKTFFKWEANKLKRFEQILNQVDGIFSIAQMDVPHFNQYAPTSHIPPFFDQKTKVWDGELFEQEKFCLFQGNLSVPENKEAVQFILSRIAPKITSKIMIAGKDPDEELVTKIADLSHVELIQNPSQKTMDELIETAQVNILFTFQQTGIKLKLLHAIESGKHVLINTFMDDSGIFKDLCQIADRPSEIIEQIDTLMKTDFTKALHTNRLSKFRTYFDNKANAQKVVNVIFENT